MTKVVTKLENKTLQLHGNGLFSKEEVSVSINKGKDGSGIVFLLGNVKIPALVSNVSNSIRNTVLTSENENICLIEHFLSACSFFNIDDIEVKTNKNELVFGDGSSSHWHEAFLKSDLSKKDNKTYELKKVLFIKDKNKSIAAIPSKNFRVSYFMDWNHPALGKLWVSWQNSDDIKKILLARTFATKEENDFFGVSDKLLTLEKDRFNKKLNEPLEPVYHKILDIVGDLRLSGINPLQINMHVIGFKSGHSLNVQLASKLVKALRATILL